MIEAQMTMTIKQKFMKDLSQAINQWMRVALAVFAIAASNSTRASESYTNWDGLAFGLVLPQTNLVIETDIPASIVISNTTDKNRVIWYSKRICDCGFGSFAITKIPSGKEIKCAIKDEDFSYSAFGLQGHKAQRFDFNLETGYALTSPGVYGVQAIGRFPINKPPANNQNAAIKTPTIVISLSKK